MYKKAFVCSIKVHSFILMPNGAKNWCVTLNNYSDDELSRFVELGRDGSISKYAIVAKEVGEEGTPHLQCFFAFTKRLSRRRVKALLGPRIHCEIARGTPSEAADYCRKDGDFVEFGTIPAGKGHRSDLSSLVADIKSGKTWDELVGSSASSVARYGKFVDRCIARYGQSRDWAPEVNVYWGSTGVGKSRKAFSESNKPYVHSGGQWFDGYCGESDVIFDDFGGSEFKLTYLLKILDRYPMRVPIKGGFVNWVPKRIWITSNYHPRDWYPNAKDEHVKALKRRFSKVIHYRRVFEVVEENSPSDLEVVVQ